MESLSSGERRKPAIFSVQEESSKENIPTSPGHEGLSLKDNIDKGKSKDENRDLLDDKISMRDSFQDIFHNIASSTVNAATASALDRLNRKNSLIYLSDDDDDDILFTANNIDRINPSTESMPLNDPSDRKLGDKIKSHEKSSFGPIDRVTSKNPPSRDSSTQKLNEEKNNDDRDDKPRKESITKDEKGKSLVSTLAYIFQSMVQKYQAF